jgi:hypothetical protein
MKAVEVVRHPSLLAFFLFLLSSWLIWHSSNMLQVGGIIILCNASITYMIYPVPSLDDVDIRWSFPLALPYPDLDRWMIRT